MNGFLRMDKSQEERPERKILLSNDRILKRWDVEGTRKEDIGNSTCLLD